MEKHKHHVSRSTRWLCLSVALCPDMAFASPLTPAVVYWFAFALAWLVAASVSLCNARQWGWRVVLPVCLSFPLVFGSMYLYYVCDGVVDDWAGQKFHSLCQAREKQATQIVAVAGGERPKHFLIDQAANSGSRVSLWLLDCIKHKQTSACAAIDLEFLELSEAWYETKSGRSRVCDEDACRPEEIIYHREERDVAGLVRIEKPVSEYVIRIGPTTDSGYALAPFKRAEKSTITLEAIGTGKVYAKTEILGRHSIHRLDKDCPEPVNEVAEMIMRVFPPP